MHGPSETALQGLIARIGAGEAIDADSIPPELSGDPSLQRLLALSRVAQGFDRRFADEVDAVPFNPGLLGPWRLLRLLGSGGMGEVWLGERTDDVVEQRVAIKRVRAQSAGVRERLFSERRLLARLEHPNIARFIDAGVDDRGSPWLVLEFVAGVPITAWCEQQALSLRARLELFAKVCAAVAHAHRHLIVHRDLKPANILVNADGEPKLLDFGIAKLLDGPDDGDTVAALTPSYAAPEQLRGEAVSTATDVYALGLLLYRLLAGALPDTRRGANAATVLAHIEEEETQRPSLSAKDASPALPYPPGALCGDLDAIVAQAIRRRPQDRYGSVAELSADLERTLQARPVLARAPTRRYRFGRFARRNRLALGLGAATAIALILGTVVSLQQARRAQLAAVSAQRELARAEQITDFLGSLFREEDPLSRMGSTGGRLDGTRRVLSDAVARVGRELGSDATSAARLLRVLGEAQFNLGELAAAHVTLDQAATRAQAAADPLLGADIDAMRAALALQELDQDTAEALFATALSTVVALRGADSVEAARIEARQALSLVALGRFKDARGAADHAQRVLAERLGAMHRESISALVTLGNIEEQLRDDVAAAQTLALSIARIEAGFGEDDARLVVPLQTLGEVVRRTRDFDRARALLQSGIGIARAQFGARNSQVSSILVRLAGVERDAGQMQRAIGVLDEAEAALPDGEDDKVRAQILNTRGSIWIELGDGVHAETDYRKSLDLRRSAGDLRSGLTWFSQAQVGTALAIQGRFAEAHQLQAEAAVKIRGLLGPDAYQNALIAVRQAQAFGLQGSFRESAGYWREAVRLIEKTYGRDHYGYFDWSLELALALEKSAANRAEAASISDDLLARWSGKPQIAGRYAELVLLRCRLHVDAGQRDAARRLSVLALARPDLIVYSAQRRRLEAYLGAGQVP
jgi:eukaryotic-like serine/threonine-protein kinase